MAVRCTLSTGSGELPWKTRERPELRRGMRSQILAVWVCWRQAPSLEGVGSITIFFSPPGSLPCASWSACLLPLTTCTYITSHCVAFAHRTHQQLASQSAWLLKPQTKRLSARSLHVTRMQNIPAFSLPVFNHAYTWPDLLSSPGKPASLLYLTTSLPDPIPAYLRKLNLVSFNRCVALGSLPQTLTVMC